MSEEKILVSSIRDSMIMMRASENKPEYFRGHQNNCASPWPTWETHSNMIRDTQKPCSDSLTWLFNAAIC